MKKLLLGLVLLSSMGHAAGVKYTYNIVDFESSQAISNGFSPYSYFILEDGRKMQISCNGFDSTGTAGFYEVGQNGFGNFNDDIKITNCGSLITLLEENIEAIKTNGAMIEIVELSKHTSGKELSSLLITH